MYNSNCGEEDRQFAEQKVHSINQYLEKKKSADKGSACNAGNLGSVLGLERSPGEGKGYSLQYSGLENSKDCIDHGVTKSDTTEQLSLSWDKEVKMQKMYQFIPI